MVVRHAQLAQQLLKSLATERRKLSNGRKLVLGKREAVERLEGQLCQQVADRSGRHPAGIICYAICPRSGGGGLLIGLLGGGLGGARGSGGVLLCGLC
eukprot:956258-Prymnesium_polylepis.1